MNNLVQALQNLISVSAEETKNFLAVAHSKKILKGQYFIREGQVPRKLAFVEAGLFRYYYVHNNGTEFTKNFIAEGNFIVAYSAMITQSASTMFIEALEDSKIYEIAYADWLNLRKENRCWNELLILMLEKAFCIKEKREKDLLLLDAEERYQGFLQEFPGLEKRVKQHLIASYLGISPVSLSRIRKYTVR